MNQVMCMCVYCLHSSTIILILILIFPISALLGSPNQFVCQLLTECSVCFGYVILRRMAQMQQQALGLKKRMDMLLTLHHTDVHTDV